MMSKIFTTNESVVRAQLSSTSVQMTDSLREINHAIAQGLRQEIARFQVKTEYSTSV
ncbi:hypothetical protein [Nostoc sp. ChiSLP03a]|uniref:hypothetical protein n=1 Tax=Nostoc sp. ChiSLP03a TaxID=3075380 RepID=UPI002AD4E125|nr:hypothetical protein [Nostoc sp. ChiSLP03a]MDZ8216302.1 hypothetical protein [Nostoc sp. ChiSLP03a]